MYVCVGLVCRRLARRENELAMGAPLQQAGHPPICNKGRRVNRCFHVDGIEITNERGAFEVDAAENLQEPAALWGESSRQWNFTAF